MINWLIDWFIMRNSGHSTYAAIAYLINLLYSISRCFLSRVFFRYLDLRRSLGPLCTFSYIFLVYSVLIHCTVLGEFRSTLELEIAQGGPFFCMNRGGFLDVGGGCKDYAEVRSSWTGFSNLACRVYSVSTCLTVFSVNVSVALAGNAKFGP